MWLGQAMSSVSHLFLTLAEEWSKRDRRGIAILDPPPQARHGWARVEAGYRINCS